LQCGKDVITQETKISSITAEEEYQYARDGTAKELGSLTFFQTWANARLMTTR
jgi:hypothetical protein